MINGCLFLLPLDLCILQSDVARDCRSLAPWWPLVRKADTLTTFCWNGRQFFSIPVP